jgi:hypothetical protein
MKPVQMLESRTYISRSRWAFLVWRDRYPLQHFSVIKFFFHKSDFSLRGVTRVSHPDILHLYTNVRYQLNLQMAS